MPPVTRSVSLMFANVAHFYSHWFMLIYPTVVIALEPLSADPTAN